LLSLAGISSFSLSVRNAHAKFSISLAGGFFQRLSEPSRNADSGFALSNQEWDPSYGGGLLLDYTGKGKWRFGTGALFMPFHYSANQIDLVTDESTPVEATYNIVRLPLRMNYSLLRHLSLNASFYYDYSLTTGISSDFGLSAGAEIRIPLGKSFRLFVAPSYVMSLRTFDGQRNTEWNAIAGIGWVR